MPERVKKAHLRRAKEQYDDESTETPGSFEEFFTNQYAEEYGGSNKKEDPNAKVIKRYMGYLAGARGSDEQEQPGVLGHVQTEGKGPYPANPDEDRDLVDTLMKSLHSEMILDSVYKQLKTSPGKTAEAISGISANFSLRAISEIRKQREITDEAETAIITMVTEDLWTVARVLGMKNVNPEFVENSTRVAAEMYNKMEDEMKMAQQRPQQPVEQLSGQQQPQPEDVV